MATTEGNPFLTMHRFRPFTLLAALSGAAALGVALPSLVQAQVPLPVVRRAQSRALVRGVIAPMGYAGTALLVVALDGVAPRWLALATVGLGVFSCVAITLRLRGAYAGAMEASVDQRKLVLNEKAERLRLGASTVHHLEQSLRSGPSLHANLAVELLASTLRAWLQQRCGSVHEVAA